MAQGSRPERVGDQIRAELSALLAREVKDPGIGFVTVTGVRVTADLQLARVYYTAMGDEHAVVEVYRDVEGVWFEGAMQGRQRRGHLHHPEDD